MARYIRGAIKNGWKKEPNNSKGRERLVAIRLPPEEYEIWKQLDNKTAFVRIALQNAVSVMVYDGLKKLDPEAYGVYEGIPFDEALADFNRKNPREKLIKDEKGNYKWQKNLAPLRENW